MPASSCGCRAHPHNEWEWAHSSAAAVGLVWATSSPAGLDQWLEDEIGSRGLVQSSANPSLWTLQGDARTVLTMFYVDDGLSEALTAGETDALVDLITFIFTIRKF
jgi:hypothetical protein